MHLEVLIDAAKRELAMRQRVYPKRVASGKMAQHKADAKTEVMAEIVVVLEALQRGLETPCVVAGSPIQAGRFAAIPVASNAVYTKDAEAGNRRVCEPYAPLPASWIAQALNILSELNEIEAIPVY